MEEKKYPIYRFYATWSQVDLDYNNGTGYTIMYKEEPTKEQLDEQLQRLKNQLSEKHKVIEFIELDYKYVEHESWVLNWFNHYTYNLFETNDEVERSFSQFIFRKQDLNIQNGHWENESRDDNKNPFYCFMGAEDRYRWNICRCEHCRAQGKITIDH